MASAMGMGAMAQSWPVPSLQAKAGARWWWLGSAVDKENLAWNMQQYAQHGIGALEITPLYGVKGNDSNNIDYLSPKWMEMLRFVEEEGKRNGIQIDMNNGTGWPFGGPEVTLDEAACKAVFLDSVYTAKQLKKGIALQVNNKEKGIAKLGLVVAYNTSNAAKDNRALVLFDGVSTAKGVRMLSEDNGKITIKYSPKDKEVRIVALYISRTKQMVKRAAPGGQGFVIDHFDKDAVRHYLEKFDRAFAASNTPWPTTMFNDSYEVYGADWTPTLISEFKTRRGYDLADNLDKLIDGDAKTVADYRETLSDMLLHNFTEQWTSWAHSHGMITRNQAHGSPANLIDIYAAVDIPEIEGFGLSEFGIKGLRTDPGKIKINDSDFSMLKYAPSAAHISGKNLVSSETFTWLTEHFRTSLSQMKPDLDLMFVAGVNHVYFHGTCYSPKNDVWPGWKFYASVDMSPTNSIWRDAPSLMNYIERCQSFLQWGTPDNDFLVYFPIHNLWERNTKNKLMQLAIHNMGKLAPDFRDAILEIDKLGFDCDYISDKYLLSSSAAEGMVKTAGGAKYKAIVIPDNAILTDEVKSKLEQLKSQGVSVIYGNDKASMDRVARPEAMRTDYALKTIRRKNEKGYHYFIANLTPDDVDRYIPLTVDYRDALWFDPLTGQRYAVEKGDNGIRVSLRSGQSMILETFDQEVPSIHNDASLKVKNVKEKEGTGIDIDHNWCLSFIDEAPKVSGSFPIDTLCTWENLDDDSVKVTMGTGVYETTFTFGKTARQKQTLAETYAIDLGDVRESARVYINNKYVGCAWSVPYILNFDGSILKKGENAIRIEVTNLPANRIADLDRHGVEWRKFNEINVVDIRYKKDKYGSWAPVPSGLNSKVRIYAVE